ncbi:TPA: type VI secretion system tip protein VgrG, partial [Salmonella enterica subsp. salamae serovar [1],40:z35:e,n,x,z15]|nr:type VI secretion system tip protein VgrG [Salmonella enterica subsp. salamae serovar [1],40:z35:e,n,x,z15]
FKDEQHGRDFTRYRMEGLRNDAETAVCLCNTPKLWPGVRFRLTGNPSETLNREWQVISSILSGEQPQALHGSQGEGTTLSNRCEVVPADRTWRVPPLPKPRVDGPQSATVTGPAGEEIFCDEHGRVRVKFRWDRYNPATEAGSCWIRVSQAWAGPGFGNLAIPRIGQEVIVDFLNGDPDQPIIMGRTYHEDNRSPGSLPGTKTQMTIRSKTYRGSGFNELRFEDATDKEQVYLHAQKNMDTEVLNDRTTTVRHDHTESITNNQKITVGVGQTVSVGSKKEGGHDQSITVANDRRITVGNDQTVRVKHDRVVNISHDEGLYVANDRKVTVEGKQEQSTTGDHISLVKGTHSLEVKGDLARKVAGALGIKVEGDIVLESSSRISLKAGGSFIVIHAGGVDITGPKINLNGGGSPGTPVGVLQSVVLEALADEGDGQDRGSGPDDSGALGDGNKADLYSLRFAFYGADKAIQSVDKLIGQPYVIRDDSANIKASGILDESGRIPKIITDKPTNLTLTLGDDKWSIEDIALDDDNIDESSSDNIGESSVNNIDDNDEIYDVYVYQVEQYLDEQYPTVPDAIFLKLSEGIKGD